MMVEGKMTPEERAEMIKLIKSRIDEFALNPEWPVIGVFNVVNLYSSNKKYFNEITNRFFKEMRDTAIASDK